MQFSAEGGTPIKISDAATREAQVSPDGKRLAYYVLDEQTKRIMIANQQKAENRRLTVSRTNIEDEKQHQIEQSRADMESSIRRIQSTIKLLAVVLPPIPAFLLFILVSLRRLSREKAGVLADRLVLR